MSRGTSNTVATSVQGSVLTPERANDLSTVLSSADDDALYELLDLQPPAAASVTNVNVGYVFRYPGNGVIADTTARKLKVDPVRVFRSSTSNAAPRQLLSGTVEAQTSVDMPAASAAGQWKIDLLYAQLAYVDPSEPTKGTTVSFFIATQAVEALVGAAPTVAPLPANTASPPTWNIPLRLVKNIGGAAVMAQEDVFEPAPPTAGGFSNRHARHAVTKLTGADFARGYSTIDNDPVSLFVGGASHWRTCGISQVLTSTITPISATGRQTAERVQVELPIPACTSAGAFGTAGTGGAVSDSIVLDDTRDWRGANFRMTAFVSSNTDVHYGEDDASQVKRVWPGMADTGVPMGATALHVSCGQSWTSTIPKAQFDSHRWCGVIATNADIQGAGPINGVAETLANGDGWGVYVDDTTGFLMWWAKRAGAAAGPPIWIVLDAYFGNHRP